MHYEAGQHEPAQLSGPLCAIPAQEATYHAVPQAELAAMLFMFMALPGHCSFPEHRPCHGVGQAQAGSGLTNTRSAPADAQQLP